MFFSSEAFLRFSFVPSTSLRRPSPVGAPLEAALWSLLGNSNFCVILGQLLFVVLSQAGWGFPVFLHMLCDFGLYPGHFEHFFMRLSVPIKSCGDVDIFVLAVDLPRWIQPVSSNQSSVGVVPMSVQHLEILRCYSDLCELTSGHSGTWTVIYPVVNFSGFRYTA